MPSNRTIIEDHYAFRQELLAIEPNALAADALIADALWVLSRDPRQGQRYGPYSPLWYFTISRLGKSQLALFYTFDDKEVLLVSIQERP